MKERWRGGKKREKERGNKSKDKKVREYRERGKKMEVAGGR